MLENIRRSYRHTVLACYTGYITQAIINNFAPLLFLTFSGQFGLSLERITLIPTLNFSVQLLVDLLSARLVDRIGYRPCVVAAHVSATLGLVALAVLPGIMEPFAGLLIAVVLYAIGGGLIEVLVSPIVEACPSDDKAGAMSLLHSFYCWGQVGLVAVSTAFFALFGLSRWPLLSCLWALVPLLNTGYFLLVPIGEIVPEGQHRQSIGELARQKVFWLLGVMMLCAGAAELAMSQWASAFVERALGLSKAMGDLLGPCVFGVLMGTARAIYGTRSARLPLRRTLMGCAVLCACCYLTAALSGSPLLALAGCAVCGFSVGVFWPGTFSMAVKTLPGGGTALFALMSLAGDLGCAAGPTVVGFVSGALDGSLKAGLLAGLIFPLGMLFCAARMRNNARKAGSLTRTDT